MDHVRDDRTKVEFVGEAVSMMKPQIDSQKTKKDDDDKFFR